MWALLMCLECAFVAEQFVKQELRRIVLAPCDQEELHAGLLLGLGQEAIEDAGHLVGLSFLCLPLRDHQQAAAIDGIADCLGIRCIWTHACCSSLLSSRWRN